MWVFYASPSGGLGLIHRLVSINHDNSCTKLISYSTFWKVKDHTVYNYFKMDCVCHDFPTDRKCCRAPLRLPGCRRQFSPAWASGVGKMWTEWRRFPASLAAARPDTPQAHSAARDGVEQILGYMSPYDVSVRCTGSSSFQIETPLKLVRLSQIHIFVVIHAWRPSIMHKLII